MGKLIGTTKIELTDVHTGEKEVREKHNMVTNALRDIFQPIGLCCNEKTYYKDLVPYYSTLLGGLLCFDTELDEDPDKYFPPTSASLVGCAVYDQVNSTDNPYRGSYNTSESEVNLEERYVKFVYDFTTNQANGTISSVCLTHQKGGYNSYGGLDSARLENTDNLLLLVQSTNTILRYDSEAYTGVTTSDRSGISNYINNNTEYLFIFDLNNDHAIYFKIVDSKHISIVKRKAFLRSVSIFDTPATGKPLVEEIELSELKNEITGLMSYNYDHANNCLYICSYQSTLSPSSHILVTEIKYDNWEVKQYDLINTSEVYLYNTHLNAMIVTDGFLYCEENNLSHDFYKFNLQNYSGVTKIENTLSSGQNNPLIPTYVINGRIYYQLYDKYTVVLNTDLNSISFCDIEMLHCQGSTAASYNSSATPIYGTQLMCFANTYQKKGWCAVENYLATINNLGAPVTKTAEKTMKITYILQEE